KTGSKIYYRIIPAPFINPSLKRNQSLPTSIGHMYGFRKFKPQSLTIYGIYADFLFPQVEIGRLKNGCLFKFPWKKNSGRPLKMYTLFIGEAINDPLAAFPKFTVIYLLTNNPGRIHFKGCKQYPIDHYALLYFRIKIGQGIACCIR